MLSSRPFKRDLAHTNLRDQVVGIFLPLMREVSAALTANLRKFNWVGQAVHLIYALRLLGTQDGLALNIRRFSLDSSHL